MKYDIFISFKCSDENGEKTPDYQIASELHKSLSDKGYNVFFSSNTLEKLGSSRYKNDIDEALDSAQVMIVVISRPEYAVSHWVQYEWDSFYNDYLSGVRSEANLFTLTSNVNINDLPRTLRNVQNFDFSKDIQHLYEYLDNIIPIKQSKENISQEFEPKTQGVAIITGRQITPKDIREAVELDSLVYDDIYHVDSVQCEDWFKVNPDIYVMAKDNTTDSVIAYVNISPITDDCYAKIRNGDFIDVGITADMILSYDMPFPYSVYFSSIVIHPNYQNSEVFMQLFNAIVEKFISFGEHGVFIRRMIADAVTSNGEKFCKLFGMNKVKSSNHKSMLYETTMIPPKFRIISKTTKQLFDYYQSKYKEAPYLFDS